MSRSSESLTASIEGALFVFVCPSVLVQVGDNTLPEVKGISNDSIKPKMSENIVRLFSEYLILNSLSSDHCSDPLLDKQL